MGPWEAIIIIAAIVAFVILFCVIYNRPPGDPPKRVVPPPRNHWEIQKKIYPCSHVRMLGDSLVGICSLERGHEGEHNMIFHNVSNGDKHEKDLS